jgi:hypothetical protein
MSNKQDIGFKLGETWTVIGTVCDSRGVPISLAGATVRLRVADSRAAVLTVSAPGDGAITDVLGGVYQFDIPPAAQDLAAFVAGTFSYEVLAEFADGKASVQNHGRFVVGESLFERFP